MSNGDQKRREYINFVIVMEIPSNLVLDR